MNYLGIDIGGTKTLLALFNEEGKIIKSQRFLTSKKYNQFLDDLKNNIDDLNLEKISYCGMSIPGLVDKNDQSIVALGNLGWKNVPIASDVNKILNCDVVIEHDSCLGGLYESRQLKNNYHKVLYITISTGIGTGLIIDNKIDTDFTTSEPGQMLVEHNGKVDKWESFASGSAIVREFGLHARDIKDQKTWNTIAKNISLGLQDLIAILEPDIIIFGGGVGNYFDNFKKPLLHELNEHKNLLIKMPKIIKASNPDNSVIYGCYELIKDKINEQSTK